MMRDFWARIDSQLEQLETATGVGDVVAALDPGSCGAFFAGGGGDVRPNTPLKKAGWTYLWSDAPYWWAMQAPDGSAITYCEGDIYLHDTRAEEAA